MLRQLPTVHSRRLRRLSSHCWWLLQGLRAPHNPLLSQELQNVYRYILRRLLTVHARLRARRPRKVLPFEVCAQLFNLRWPDLCRVHCASGGLLHRLRQARHFVLSPELQDLRWWHLLGLPTVRLQRELRLPPWGRLQVVQTLMHSLLPVLLQFNLLRLLPVCYELLQGLQPACM